MKSQDAMDFKLEIIISAKSDFSEKSATRRKIACNETENFSSILKVDFGPKSTLQAKECRNIEPLSVRSLKSIYGQILHYKPRNTGKINHAGSILGSNWESMRVP